MAGNETLEIQRLVGKVRPQGSKLSSHPGGILRRGMAPVPVKRKAEIKNAGKPPVKRGRPKGSKNKSKPSAVELEAVGDPPVKCGRSNGSKNKVETSEDGNATKVSPFSVGERVQEVHECGCGAKNCSFDGNFALITEMEWCDWGGYFDYTIEYLDGSGSSSGPRAEDLKKLSAAQSAKTHDERSDAASSDDDGEPLHTRDFFGAPFDGVCDVCGEQLQVPAKGTLKPSLRFMVCDGHGCNNARHQRCCNPKITGYVRKQSWFCGECRCGTPRRTSGKTIV